MDLLEIQVALELFKLLPTQKSTSDGVLMQMTVDERLAVFEKGSVRVCSIRLPVLEMFVFEGRI